MKILSIAPTRISLFGGGTDIDSFSSKYGGLVISMAVNIRQKITMYSDDDLYEIHGHKFPLNANPEFYYQILDEYAINDGLHLTKLRCEFDGLIEGGLGSSASAAVALIGAINKRKNLGMSKHDIALKAWDIEVNKIGLFGGKQDQFAAAYGGFNAIEFNNKVTITPLIPAHMEALLSSLVLFYTGNNRKKSKLQENLRELLRDQEEALLKIKSIATEALEPIVEGDIEKVGKLLDRVWKFKKLSNKTVTNAKIDSLYVRGIKYGAWGGKILGSGGGGYMIFMVNPKKRQRFIEKMKIPVIDFLVDWNGLEVRELNDY